MTRASSRVRLFVYFICVSLALPPGFGLGTVFAASRTSTFTRDSVVETFRNPQFSSGGWNRFLYAMGPQGLVADGVAEFQDPEARGYSSNGGLQALWLSRNGALEWADSDAFVRGVGLDLSFQRMWRSSVTTYDGPLGNQWEFTWNKRLFEESDNDVVFHEMGRKETYNEASGTYSSPAGRYDTLAKDTGPNPDIFTRTDKYGVVETYEDEGSGWYRLTEIEDTNDNALTFAYDTNAKLTAVTDTLARDTTLAYDTNGRITKITDPASREWDYLYDGSGNLTQVNDAEDAAWKYHYDASDRMTAIEQPTDGGTPYLAFEYDTSTSPKQITKQTVNGGAYLLDHVTGGVTVTDPLASSNDILYEYDANRMITSRKVNTVPPGGFKETTYSYNSDGEVTLVEFPRANQVAYTYDGSGNVTTLEVRANSSDTVNPPRWTYTYTSLNRVSTITDPIGNTWDYDHDADGNVTARTAPAVTSPSGIASTDKNGNGINDGTISESYEYNSSGLMTKRTDARDTEFTYSYHLVNSKAAYLDTETRDSAIGGLAIELSYDVDAVGNVTSSTDGGGDSTTYAYDLMDRVTQEVQPLSVTRKTVYDDAGRATAVSRTNDTAVGNSWFVTDTTYDKLGNVLNRTVDIDGTATRQETINSYDLAGRLTKRVSPRDKDTLYVYDTRGQEISLKRMVGPSSSSSTILTYDDNGNIVTRTDPLGNATVSMFDRYDRLTKTIDPEGHYTLLQLDKLGRVTSRAQHNSATTKLTETKTHFDESGRTYKTERWAKKADLTTDLTGGSGWQTADTWLDEDGAALERSGDICGCSAYSFVYDALGRQVTYKDALSGSEQNSIVYEYDDDSRVTKTTRKDKSQDTGLHGHQDLVTESVYDARGNMITSKRIVDVSTSYDTIYAYGDRDQLTKVTDPAGRVAKYEHNEQLWRTKEIQETAGDDVITEFTHDADGNVTERLAKNSTGGDQATTYDYDDLGRLTNTEWADTELLDPRNTAETFDLAGNKVSTTQRNGTVIDRSYDDANRLTSLALTLAAGVVGPTSVTYEYDGAGRITEAATEEASGYTSVVERSHNTLGKIEAETQVIDGWNSGNGRTITYTYNVKGQKTATEYPVSGDDITYFRDDLDRVDKISLNTEEVVDYTYLGSRVIQKEFPGSTDNRDYDDVGRLTSIHHKDTSSGNTLAKFDYELDDGDMIIEWDRFYYDDVQNTRLLNNTHDEGSQFAYDGAGRLVTSLRGVPTAEMGDSLATNLTDGDYDEKVEWIYDQVGNRLTQKIDATVDQDASYDEINALTTLNAGSRNYNDNGNFDPVTGGTYQYDYRNQLGRLSVHANGRVYAWHHDAFGRTIERALDGSSKSTRTYFDGKRLVERISCDSGTEALLRNFVFGSGARELLSHRSVNGGGIDVYYALGDENYSVQLLVDGSGVISESYRYREFGDVQVLDASFLLTGGGVSPLKSPFRHAGRPLARLVAADGEQWYDEGPLHYSPTLATALQRFWGGRVGHAGHERRDAAALRSLGRDGSLASTSPGGVGDIIGPIQDGIDDICENPVTAAIDCLACIACSTAIAATTAASGGLLAAVSAAAGKAACYASCVVCTSCTDQALGNPVQDVVDAFEDYFDSVESVAPEIKKQPLMLLGFPPMTPRLPAPTPCLASGTKVLTPSGARRIEDLCVGDGVYSFDEDSGAVRVDYVTRVHHGVVDEASLVQVFSGVLATAGHRFLDRSRGWVAAKDIGVGGDESFAQFVTMDGQAPSVGSSEVDLFFGSGLVEVRDLQLRGGGGYFVGDGVLAASLQPLPLEWYDALVSGDGG